MGKTREDLSCAKGENSECKKAREAVEENKSAINSLVAKAQGICDIQHPSYALSSNGKGSVRDVCSHPCAGIDDIAERSKARSEKLNLDSREREARLREKTKARNVKELRDKFRKLLV